MWARSFVACITASLTSAPDSIKYPPCNNQKCLHTLPEFPWGGKSPQWKPLSYILLRGILISYSMRCMPFDLALAQLKNLLCRNTVWSGSIPDGLVFVGKPTGLPWSFTICYLISASVLWGGSTVIPSQQMETVRLRIRDLLDVP